MLNEISKTDAGFKKGGINFTLVFEAWAHNTRNSFSGVQDDEVLNPRIPLNPTIYISNLPYKLFICCSKF